MTNMEKTIRFVPKNVPILTARFLSENEQESYQEAVSQFKNEKARSSLDIPLNESNLFKVLLLNQMGIRTATLAELIHLDDDCLKLTCEDAPSVVLRGKENSPSKNDYLVRSSAKLIRKRTFRNPIVINGLELVEDNNSDYGLNFTRGKNFNFFEAPELLYSHNGRKFSRQDERGMPIFDSNGNRTLYTRSDGLSRLSLHKNLNLYSGDGSLANSSQSGRVVVVEENKGDKK